jgi:YVTN family beta-propeller protein
MTPHSELEGGSDAPSLRISSLFNPNSQTLKLACPVARISSTTAPPNTPNSPNLRGVRCLGTAFTISTRLPAHPPGAPALSLRAGGLLSPSFPLRLQSTRRPLRYLNFFLFPNCSTFPSGSCKLIHSMNRLKSFRVYFVLSVLLALLIVILLREHRPSFLRPDLHLNAYISTADGSVTILDLANLRILQKIAVGSGIADMREHAKRPEIWGVCSTDGYLWVLDGRTSQISWRIPVGPLPFSLDFSPAGDRVYTTSSASDQLLAIDVSSRSIIGRAKTGAEPVQARATADKKFILVVNRRAATLGIHDAATLQQRAAVSVIPQPDEVLVVPDGTVAFVMSRSETRLSVVDLRRGVLITNLELAGKPTQMLVKPDGGELYVISPEAHGLQVVNTWTHELGDYMPLGSAPTNAIITPDSFKLYVADSAASRVVPVEISNRLIDKPINVGATPGTMRFDTSDPAARPSMLLVVNESSGDLAIIRTRTDSLITMIPVGPHPSRLAVKLF